MRQGFENIDLLSSFDGYSGVCEARWNEVPVNSSGRFATGNVGLM